MMGAYVLAGELKKVNGDFTLAFENYEKLLRPFIEKKQKAARKFAGSFAPKTALGLFFRNQITKLLGLPIIAELTLGRDLRDTLNLPSYPP